MEKRKEHPEWTLSRRPGVLESHKTSIAKEGNRRKASRFRVHEWLSGYGRALERLEGGLLQLSERSSMLSSW